MLLLHKTGQGKSCDMSDYDVVLHPLTNLLDEEWAMVEKDTYIAQEMTAT